MVAQLLAIYRDLMCPQYIWDLVAAVPVPLDLVSHLQPWIAQLGPCQGGVPLTLEQTLAMLDLIAAGTKCCCRSPRTDVKCCFCASGFPEGSP